MNRRKKIVVFLFFLMLSTLLWFLDALNQPYKTELKVPVSYLNWPNGKISMSDLPDYLNVTVSGYGFDILNYNLKSSLVRVKIDLGQVELTPQRPGDTVHYYLLTQKLHDQVTAQLAQGLKVLSIKPDTLFFTFTSLATKIVPVKLDAQFSFASQYTAKGKPVIIPRTVSVTAPAVLLDSIEYIPTKEYVFINLDKDLEQELNLLVPKHVVVKPSKVLLRLQVERYTEVRTKVPLNVINVPDNLSLKVFPQEVTVKYLVGFSNYKKVSGKDFYFVVDYADLKRSVSGRLPVKVLHVPKNIISYSFYPSSVDYIIESKND